MVDAKELIELQNSESPVKALRVAEVVELFPTGTAKVQFRGEDIPSEKEYSYLASYNPAILDEVLLIPLLDTYIILGKIKFQEAAEPENYVTIDGLNDILEGYVSSENLADYASKEEVDTSIKTYLGWDEYGTINNLATGGDNLFSRLRVGNRFYHSGSSLGFFGTSPTSKSTLNTVSTSESTSMSTCLGYINNIVNLLKRYGLC